MPKGFTLFEVMVAMAILAMAGIALLQAMSVAVRLHERALKELAAVWTLEEVRSTEGGKRGEMRQGPYMLRFERQRAPSPLPGLPLWRLSVEEEDGMPLIEVLEP